MSSRKRKPADNENEFYVTPAAAIYSLLESNLIDLPGGTWVEPCAGTGSIVRTVNASRDDVNWIMCDIDEGFDAYLRPLCRPGRDILQPYGDWVHAPWDHGMVDVAIFNPPFSLTMQFIEAALMRARLIVALQRTNFFGSQQRAPWLRTHCPDVYSLPFRPSFRPDGSTDSIEYSWFVWRGRVIPDREHRTGTIAMLEPPTGRQLQLQKMLIRFE